MSNGETFNQRILLRLWWLHRNVNFKQSDGDHLAIPEEVQMHVVKLHKVSEVTKVTQQRFSTFRGRGFRAVSL